VISAAFLSLSLSLLSAVPAPAARSAAPSASGAVVARVAELRNGWSDLDRRARSFLRAPVVASTLRGGGVAVDRAGLFAAAERALARGRAGYSLTLLDSDGDPVAWAGRAPTFFPTGDPSGAIWSAETVVFYRTLDFRFPPDARSGRLVAAWRLSRFGHGAFLSPQGPWRWDDDASADRGGVEPGKSRDQEDRARRVARGAFLAGSVALLLFSAFRAPRAGILASAAAAAALAWGAAGTAALVGAPLKFEPSDYLRDPAVLAGFSLAVVAAALFARRGGPFPIAVLGVLAAAAFALGTLRPDPVGVAGAFGLVLAGLLAVRAGSNPFRIAGVSALCAAALFGPLVLEKQQRAIREERDAAARSRAGGRTPDAAAARSAGEVESALGRLASRFAGARQQDLGDLAFVVWKETGLAREAPISGVRLWREGRLVSRFSTGIPLDSGTEATVGNERVSVTRRRLTLSPRAEFAAGEAPDEAEVEAAQWPIWKSLPEAYRDYRALLLDRAPSAPAETPRASERLLESVTAATAAVLACAVLGGFAAIVVLLGSGRKIHLRPLTFRGRITALFTVLVLLPFVAVTVFMRQSLANRLRRETVTHAQTALETARTVLDDYLFAAGTSAGRRQLIDDDLLGWMAKIVGHDLSIYSDGRLLSTSRRELFASGLLPERIDGGALGKILRSPGGFVVETRLLLRRPFDQVEAPLASLPGRLSWNGPAVLSIPLLPEQRETEEEIARLSASLTVFTLAVFGLSLLLGARTAFRVTGPIADLVEGTHAVARGEIPRIPEPADEELKRLVAAFLSMADTLDQQREDLARAQRLRAWAEMARIIAHEIKNPLTPIRLSAEHLREVWKRHDPARDQVLEECVANILRQTESLRAIASEFADYARLPEPHRESVALRPLAEEIVGAYSASPRIVWRLAVPDVRAEADAKLVARALTNLVANARESLGEAGGAIAVELHAEGGRWTFRVEDDGPGVAAENMPKLFEPYFSSKTGGSGLGLAIVRKIAQEHGGDARAFRLSPRGFAVEFDFADAVSSASA